MGLDRTVDSSVPVGTTAEIGHAAGSECDPVPPGDRLPMGDAAERVPESQQRLSSFSTLELGRGMGADQYRVAGTSPG